MKKVLTIIILMVMSVTSMFSQERINRTKLTYSIEGSKITEATGWSFNSSLGEWIDYPNVIDDSPRFKERAKMLAGEYHQSRNKQSFISMNMNKLIYENTSYYILLIEKWTGYFKYPAIKEDWRSYKKATAYVFDSLTYQKFKQNDSLYELNVIFSQGSIGSLKYDKQELLDNIQSTLISGKYRSSESFPVMLNKEGDFRFLLPDSFISYSKNISTLDRLNFDKRYFEISKTEFSKLFIE